jgi:uncharacterized Zn finger protein
MSDLVQNDKGGARSWWAAQWNQALSRWFDPERLARGDTLARQGRVFDLAVQVGQASARVQGVEGVEHDVHIDVRCYTDDQWQRIVSVLAEQAMYTAQLLNGEMPHDIDAVFRSAGVSLFPRAAAELNTDCTCTEWARPCSHVVAACHKLGEMLDVDPFTLLVLRGRSREQVMADLRAERAERLGNGDGGAGYEGEEQVASLDADPEAFWRMGAELDELQVRVRRPEIEMELVRILGAPDFAGDAGLAGALEQVYERVTARALRVAYEGDAQDDVASGGHEEPLSPKVTPQHGLEEERS